MDKNIVIKQQIITIINPITNSQLHLSECLDTSLRKNLDLTHAAT